MLCLTSRFETDNKGSVDTGPDPDFRVFGGHNQVRGQGGRLGPLWVQGKGLVGGSGGEAPDGKRFSVF